MREIKFRAWDGIAMGVVSTIWLQWQGKDWHVPGEKQYKELIQFTGLKDKNGVEIYSGDIVKYTNPRHYSENGVFEVEFDQGAFFAGYHTGSSTSKRPKLIIGKRVEVIGNRFQNPELLTNQS